MPRPVPLAPASTPSYSTVRVLDADGVLLRVISHAELQARGEVIPDLEGKHAPIYYGAGRADAGAYPTVAASPRRPYKRPVRKQLLPVGAGR